MKKKLWKIDTRISHVLTEIQQYFVNANLRKEPKCYIYSLNIFYLPNYIHGNGVRPQVPKTLDTAFPLMLYRVSQKK